MLAFVYSVEDNDSVLGGENSDWKASASTDIKDKLKSAKLDNIPEISRVLEASLKNDGRVFDLGVKERLLPLKSWASESGRVILLGDSAHPMAPFMGQGANQAMQDAYSLASLIAKYNRGEIGSLAAVTGELQWKRKLPTAKLALKSSVIGRIETLPGSLGCFIKDNFFRVTSGLGIIKKEFVEAATPKL